MNIMMIPFLATGFLGDLNHPIGSGAIHINYIEGDLSRLGMLSVLLNTSTGDYLKRGDLRTVKTLAYRLEPVSSEQGQIFVDGEMIRYGVHQVQLHPQVARIMTRKRLNARDDNATKSH